MDGEYRLYRHDQGLEGPEGRVLIRRSPDAEPAVSHRTRIAAICRADTIAALSASRWLAHLPGRSLEWIVKRRSDAFAHQLLDFDNRIASHGLTEACTWGLTQWAGPVSRFGNIAPPDGPLLIVSNHPGLVDAAALLSHLAGHDIRLLVAERRLFETMPALSRHLIPVAESRAGRVRALRAAAHHLRRGGTVVTYPAGRIEPDPVVRPADALAALAAWSPSTTCLARLVPRLTVQPVVVGGVIAPRYRAHWLARPCLKACDRDTVAAALQALSASCGQQATRLSIGRPVHAPTTATLHTDTIRALGQLMGDLAPRSL